MREKWIEYAKKADFYEWAEKLGITPFTARVIRNRDMMTLQEADDFLNGSPESFADPYLMKDMKKGIEILVTAINAGNTIAIATDFDDDGIFSGEILYEGIRKVGGKARLYTPDRVSEGYGLNERIVDEAISDGCSLILTCDNGIAAFSAVAYAKEKGLTVVVTDHHEVQFTEENGKRNYILPEADALIDPKQEGDEYPFKHLCGAGVAFRLIDLLYEFYALPMSALDDLYEYAAIATVADVVPLIGENRIIVKEGLRRLRSTKKISIMAICEACGLEPQQISTYHLGFVIGPCFNAVGRLSNASLAYNLLHAETMGEALKLAAEIKALNVERQEETDRGHQMALQQFEDEAVEPDKVLIVYLEKVHESVIGIVAGRLKERFSRPVFVFTDTDEGEGEEQILKGSGRSIEAYHMLEHLIPAAGFLERFGGHSMAAGLSIRRKNFEAFRKFMNENCGLSEDDLTKIVHIDIRLPMNAISDRLLYELENLEPCGTSNPRPLFALPHFKIRSMRVLGNKGTTLKLEVYDNTKVVREALLFNRAQELLDLLKERYGESEVDQAMKGLQNNLDIGLAYELGFNEFRGNKKIQMTIRSFMIF